MEELRISERPTLRRPVLVAAFRGWNDGGQAATVERMVPGNSAHSKRI